MSVVKADSLFPIIPEAASVRLFFAKNHPSDAVWHLCDMALSFWENGRLEYLALHGQRMVVNCRADTVMQAEAMRSISDRMCSRCMEEFALAFPIIKRRKLMRFE